jgi:hypothetical protein
MAIRVMQSSHLFSDLFTHINIDYNYYGTDIIWHSIHTPATVLSDYTYDRRSKVLQIHVCISTSRTTVIPQTYILTHL